MQRFGVRRLRRYYAGGLAMVAFAALVLFVVLPALASNVNDTVPPPSGAGVLPVDVGVGGNQSCSSAGLFPNMTGLQQTTDPSPSTGTYPSGQGWNFKLTIGALPGFTPNKGQSLAVDSQGNAAILGIAIKGGTDNLSYDYRNTAQGWVSADTNLHAPASKYTAGLPETDITQYYGVSQLVICWKPGPLTTISGNAYQDISANPNPGIPGLTVTLKDATTPGTQIATTDAGGNYSFSAIPGDDYTVCIQAPSFGNVQTAPAVDQTGGACAAVAGDAANGYSISSLPPGGVSGESFGFQPLSSVGGRVYEDLSNPANAKYDAGTDAPQSGWTVTLYANTGTAGSPVWTQAAQQTSDSNGLYNFANALTPGGDYLVCERPPTGDQTLWAQSQPVPTATSQCSSPDLQYGYRFTASSSDITGDNFGNMAGVSEGTCGPPPPPFGSDLTNGELSIQLAACKPNQVFVFNTATSGDPNFPWVSVFAGDQTQPKVPLIEKVVFPDPIVNGAPSLQHLAYTDTFPYDPNNTKPMPYCQLDPRDPAGGAEGMMLSSDLGGIDYTQDANKGLVLPNDIGTQTQATSCAISIRTYVDGSGAGWLEAFVYTDIDGLTKGTN